jgi:photosystem II stability/assembly factor-like uncharacterized protein
MASLSTDFGATWTAVGAISTKPSPPIEAIAADGRTVIAVAADGGFVAHSSDAGTTWSQTNAGSARLRAVWHAGSTWYVAGDDEAIYISPDGGKAWTQLKGPGKHYSLRGGWAGGATIVITGTEAPRSGRGDVGPPRAVVLRSTDAGKTWTEQQLDTFYWLGAIAGDGKRLVATANHGRIAESRDAGKTWRALAVPTHADTTAVWTDGTTILVGGDHGQIWRGP